MSVWLQLQNPAHYRLNTHTQTHTNMSQPASTIKSRWPQNMTPSFLAHSCANAVQTEWAEHNTVSCQTDRPPVTQTSRINKHPGKKNLRRSKKDLQTWFKVLVQPSKHGVMNCSWIVSCCSKPNDTNVEIFNTQIELIKYSKWKWWEQTSLIRACQAS